MFLSLFCGTLTPMDNQEETNGEKTHFPRKTLLLIIFLIFAAGGLSTLAIYINNAPRFLTPTPTPIKVIADTVLTISKTPQKQSSASAYKTDVLIDTGENKVTKAQLELNFDPNLITNIDINQGPFFANGQVILKNIDLENGRISFAIAQGSDENGVTGSGVLATILFYASKNLPLGGIISINFEPKTQVSALDTSSSVLKSAIGASFALTKAPIKISSGSSTFKPIATQSGH